MLFLPSAIGSRKSSRRWCGRLLRAASASSSARLLTDPQDQALRAAVHNGYYRIPRPLNLQQLAKHLHISSASLSERLRRAEGRVLTRYVHQGGVTPWDQHTIFDETSPDAGLASWPHAEAPEAHEDPA